MTAAALAPLADVTLVERDDLPDQPHPRRGVPQARHAHLVWSGGVTAFDELIPGAINDILARGGRLAHIMGDMVCRAPNGIWFRRFLSNRHRALVSSRDLMDFVLRDLVLALGSVSLRPNTTVIGIEGDASRVTGVRIRTGEEESILSADLIVDASGRGSRAPQWLQGLGLPRVAERVVDAGVTYATRLFNAPAAASNTEFPLINVQANPAAPPGKGGLLLPIEGNRWLVTLRGTRGGEPTTDPNAFVDFALSLPDPLIGCLIRDAEPLDDITISRSTANRRRYYEKLKSWPDGFVAIGDAIAGFNPVYGHGLTVAAQSAIAVRDVLRVTSLIAPGTARRLQHAAARPVSAAWSLALGQDAFYPGATEAPPSTVERLLARYVDRAVATGARNPQALEALLDVMSLEKPPVRLFSPGMLVPMLFGPKRPRLVQAPLRDAERKVSMP